MKQPGRYVEIENKYFASHLWRIDRALTGDKSANRANSAGHVNSTLSSEMIKQHLIKLNCAAPCTAILIDNSSLCRLQCSSERFVSGYNVGFCTAIKVCYSR